MGNPGAKYAGTRHNIGFLVLDRLAEAWKAAPRRELCRSKVGEGEVDGESVRLAWPQTFMNSSGEAVACLMKRWRLEPSEMLIVFDDVYLPLGRLRLRGEGSEGGHQGMASIIQGVGTQEIPRLRLGIGPGPRRDLMEFVLDRFTGPEKEGPLENALELAVQACETWVTQGLSAAMNRFNRRA